MANTKRLRDALLLESDLSTAMVLREEEREFQDPPLETFEAERWEDDGGTPA